LENEKIDKKTADTNNNPNESEIQGDNLTDYDEANRLRWLLAESLIKKTYGYVIPLYPYNYKKPEKAGKIPCLKNWQNSEIPIPEILEQWRGKSVYMNLGLVLGSKSGIVAVDVDGGVEGMAILQELSNGDVPVTITYTTPGGGMRYLYLIPNEHRNNLFKKFTQTGEGEHCEVALMGDGQQTVLPYSIHPNGGIYKFVEGKSFDDIEIAPAPEWIIKLMMKPTITEIINSIDNDNSNTDTDDDENDDSELQLICKRCRRLYELLEEQATTGIHEEVWFSVMCLFINAGFVELAREFSKLSLKHSLRSDRRIDELIEQDKKYFVKCSSLGCCDSDILKCFRKHRLSESGEIINSPLKKIQADKDFNKSIGFLYEKGKFIGINPNIYSKYILKNFNLAYDSILGFYLYINNFWQQKADFQIKTMLYNFFEKYEPDEWSYREELAYMGVLPYICKKTDSMPVPKNYINVQNGLVNLSTFDLEPHNDSTFTMVQLPIEYDKNTMCPQFIGFLKETLFNDFAMIALIQEILGYCLSYETKAQKFFVFLGDGANGKSVLCDVLFEIAGGENYVSTVSLKDLERPFALSQIVGKTLNIATENEIRGMDTATLKAISSGDPHQMEKKFKDVFSYRPFTKLLFSVNRMPFLNDKSYGIERRLIIVPFDKKFVVNPTTPFEGKKISGLAVKLLEEKNGIFNFAMEGYKRLQKNDFEFTEPTRVKALLEDYKLEINPYLDFIRDCIEPAKSSSTREITTKDLRAAYDEWCNATNRKKMLEVTIRTFLKELRLALRNENITFSERKSNGDYFFKNIKLTEKAERFVKINRGAVHIR
jgi:putative DNA primase/helicase